jgi:putative addiction module antidote
MIELKVRKFGKSLGVALPKEVVKRLRVSEGKSVFLFEEADGSYRLLSQADAFVSKMAKADDIMRRYGKAMQKLAQ